MKKRLKKQMKFERLRYISLMTKLHEIEYTLGRILERKPFDDLDKDREDR